jgi:hypothetical protein
MEGPNELDPKPQPLTEGTQPSELVMPDDQYNELLRVVGVYKRQAEKCATAGAPCCLHDDRRCFGRRLAGNMRLLL